ncbi:hypothetical protein EI001_22885, partial [Escherichia coli]|nr:hypothetical protein [Escherichia coli]
GTVCVVGKIRDLILQLSKSSIYSTKPWRGRKMNDCPRHYTQKKAAYRSVLPDVRNKPFRRVSDC